MLQFYFPNKKRSYHRLRSHVRKKKNLRLSGVPGVRGPAGDSGAEPGTSTAKLEAAVDLVLRRVMLRVTGTSSRAMEGDRAAENESYLRSLLRPESGAGPASVSSQSL